MVYEIYGRKNCVYCKRAKSLLTMRNIEYAYVDIEATNANFNLFVKLFPDAKSVPQIMRDDGTYIGGYDDLKEYLDGSR